MAESRNKLVQKANTMEDKQLTQNDDEDDIGYSMNFDGEDSMSQSQQLY